MKAILRTTTVVAALASALAGSPSVSAQDAGHYQGPANINCFGCGISSGTASLTFTGYYNGYAVVNGPAFASYTVVETPSQCPVTGSATGTVVGAVNVVFNWTRVGATAVVTTSGDINGGSVAVFAVTSPVGNPCGGPVQALVQGAVAGT